MQSVAPMRRASGASSPIEAWLFRKRCSRSSSPIGSELGCSTRKRGLKRPANAIISAMNATFSARALSSSTEMSSVREKGRWTDQTFSPEVLMSARAFSARS